MTRQLLHHLLVETAERSPEATAVAFRGETMTYGALDAWSDRLAHLLVDVGVRRGDRVGIYREKSSGSVAAIYALLKAGAAYVPLDPHAPPARLAYIARNCGLRWLITAEEKLPLCRQMVEKQAPLEAVILPDVVPARRSDPAETLPPGVRLLAADAVAAQPASPPAVRGIELDLAYILYTSGSTGEPKGVMISHLNSLAFVRWAHQAIQVRADDVLSNHAPWHFDLSIFDVFAAVLAGAATLAPVPAEMSVFPVQLAEFIAQTGITVWYSVPSVLNLLLLRGNLKPGAFPRLRTVLFAGEGFPTPHPRRATGPPPPVPPRCRPPGTELGSWRGGAAPPRRSRRRYSHRPGDRQRGGLRHDRGGPRGRAGRGGGTVRARLHRRPGVLGRLRAHGARLRVPSVCALSRARLPHRRPGPAG